MKMHAVFLFMNVGSVFISEHWELAVLLNVVD